MSTRNFVPRADGEGSIGTSAKNWLSGYFKQLNVASVTVDDSKKPAADTTDLTTLLSNLANEVKQNKGTDDWKTAPATNLATLAALVGNLASGSDVTWEGNKFTNAKLGITGLMEQNGYICFGKNFGGLILQWGLIDLNTPKWTFNLPIAFSDRTLAFSANDCGNGTYSLGIDAISKSQFTVYWNNTKNSQHVIFFWMAIGRWTVGNL